MSERETRLERLKKLKEQGIAPYPAKTARTHYIAEAMADFDTLAENKTPLTLAGRLISRRAQGKACFADLEDQTGRIQLFARADEL
jgi:lysyl-tRNA synthetase class 2